MHGNHTNRASHWYNLINKYTQCLLVKKKKETEKRVYIFRLNTTQTLLYKWKRGYTAELYVRRNSWITLTFEWHIIITHTHTQIHKTKSCEAFGKNKHKKVNENKKNHHTMATEN